MPTVEYCVQVDGIEAVNQFSVQLAEAVEAFDRLRASSVEPITLTDRHEHVVELFAGSGEVEPPRERLLFARGETATQKGTFLLDERGARSVMDDFAKHGVDLSFDYDHKMLDPNGGPEHGIAAGWFRPEVRNGDLWATNIQWTPRAEQMIRAREFRYISPAFFAERSSGRIVRLINVALTNRPATFNIRPLTTSADTETHSMDLIAILSGLLGCEANEAAVAAAAKAKLDDHTATRAELRQARDIVGLPEGELPAHLTAMVAASHRVPQLESDVAALTEKVAKYEAADLARFKAEADAKHAAALAEVNFIIEHSEKYELGKFADADGARKMLLAAREAAPEAFAHTYKAALDGMRAGDIETGLLTDASKLAPAPGDDKRELSGGDATADVIAKAEALAKKDGIPLSAALSRVHADAVASVG